MTKIKTLKLERNRTPAELTDNRARGMEAIGCQRTATASAGHQPHSAGGAPAEAVSPEQAVVVVCASRNQAERLVSEIAAATRARDLLTAQREESMAKLKAKFEQQLTACENEIKTKSEAIESWAKANRGAEFAERESIETTHGVAGFRKSWSLKLLIEDWKEVTARIRKSAVWRKLYLRIKYEPDRRQMLADLAKEKLTVSDAKKIGVERWQEETFYIDVH